MSSPILTAALRYSSLGLSVIPTAPNSKKPAVPWKRFQERRADESQLRQWFGSNGDRGIAVVLGRVSEGTCCRDFDVQASYERWAGAQRELAATLPTATTARGQHVYFRSSFHGFADLGDGEYRGDGHYCLVPPSRHPDGPLYTWLIPPADEIPLVADVHAAGFLPPNSTVYTEYAENTENAAIVDSVSAVSAVSSVLHEQLDRVVRESLPTGPGRRNRQVFQLARALKGIPALADADADSLRPIVKQWHTLALPHIETKDFTETWIDFLQAWPRVKIPKGATMEAVMQKALELPPPKIAEQYEDGPIRRLIALCRQLASQGNGGTFYLSCRTAGELLGVSHVQANRWLFLLDHDKVVKQVSKGERGKRQAAEYRWIAEQT